MSEYHRLSVEYASVVAVRAECEARGDWDNFQSMNAALGELNLLIGDYA